MEELTKILIGVGVGAGALVGFGLYEANKNAQAATTPAAATAATGGAAPVTAAGPYTPATALTPGVTYLLSAAAPAGTTVSVFTAPGFTVNQAWPAGQVPANWPSTDVDPTRIRASVTYTGATPTSPSSILIPGITVFQTGAAKVGAGRQGSHHVQSHEAAAQMVRGVLGAGRQGSHHYGQSPRASLAIAGHGAARRWG